MPHLPPPPEMLELQKNSFFPVDVPKIGASDAPYRPPELIFDEMHRRVNSFQPQNKQKFKRKIESEKYQPTEKTTTTTEARTLRPEPKKSLRKFSDLEIISPTQASTNFGSSFNQIENEDYLR